MENRRHIIEINSINSTTPPKDMSMGYIITKAIYKSYDFCMKNSSFGYNQRLYTALADIEYERMNGLINNGWIKIQQKNLNIYIPSEIYKIIGKYSSSQLYLNIVGWNIPSSSWTWNNKRGQWECKSFVDYSV